MSVDVAVVKVNQMPLLLDTINYSRYGYERQLKNKITKERNNVRKS
jgi:hypothetical protein